MANAAVAGMFLTAYVALEWVSFIHEYKGVPVTPWNPGLGVVFALMVFVGSWGGFVLFTGVVTAEIFVLQSRLEWPIVIGVGAITSLSYAFVAAVARRHWHLDVGLIHLRDVLVLLAVGLAGAAIDTVLYVFLSRSGSSTCATSWASAPPLVGDIIGIAGMTLLLRLFPAAHRTLAGCFPRTEGVLRRHRRSPSGVVGRKFVWLSSSPTLLCQSSSLQSVWADGAVSARVNLPGLIGLLHLRLRRRCSRIPNAHVSSYSNRIDRGGGVANVRLDRPAREAEVHGSRRRSRSGPGRPL
jgi:hypothetical protein